MVRFFRVSKKYKDGKGIEDCSWDAYPGQVTGIIGPNGCGKTTSFRLLAGLSRKDSGKIQIDCEELEENHKKIIGYMPEEKITSIDCTVLDLIFLMGRLKGVKKSDLEGQVLRVISKLGLEKMRLRKVSSLSKGNGQLVSFACAIVHEPKVLILDEPFSGLDFERQKKMMGWINDYKKEHTVLISLHERGLVNELCDHTIWMHEGKVVEEDVCGAI